MNGFVAFFHQALVAFECIMVYHNSNGELQNLNIVWHCTNFVYVTNSDGQKLTKKLTTKSLTKFF